MRHEDRGNPDEDLLTEPLVFRRGAVSEAYRTQKDRVCAIGRRARRPVKQIELQHKIRAMSMAWHTHDFRFDT